MCICDWRSIKQATPKDDFVSHQTGDALVDCLSIVVAAVVAFVVVVVSVSNISNVQLKSSLVFFFLGLRDWPLVKITIEILLSVR